MAIDIPCQLVESTDGHNSMLYPQATSLLQG